MLLGQQFGLGAAEAHRAGAGILLHLAHHEESDAEDQQEGQRLHQDVHPDAGGLLGLGREGDIVLPQASYQLGIGRRGDGAEGLVTGHPAGDDLLADDHRLDLAFVDPVQELGIGNGIARRGRTAADQLDDQQQGQKDARPRSAGSSSSCCPKAPCRNHHSAACDCRRPFSIPSFPGAYTPAGDVRLPPSKGRADRPQPGTTPR